MSTRKVLTLVSVVAMLVSPAAYSFDPTADANEGSFQVLGEKQDSGLGDLSPSYTAAGFQTRIAGEKLDSGLGGLSPSYTAAEYQRGYRVAGESLDSGLGSLPANYTAAEFQKTQIIATR
jgi:hypothetical protein